MEIQNCMLLISTSSEKVLQCITQLSCWLLGKVIVGFCVPSRSTWFITFNYAAKRWVCRTTLLMLRRGSFIGVDINARNQRDQEKTIIKIARELATIGDEIYSKCMQLKSQWQVHSSYKRVGGVTRVLFQPMTHYLMEWWQNVEPWKHVMYFKTKIK